MGAPMPFARKMPNLGPTTARPARVVARTTVLDELDFDLLHLNRAYIMFHIAVLLLVGCGGEIRSDGDAGAKGDDASPHGPPCTQATCGSSVQTLSSVSTAEGEQLIPTGLFVGGGFIYVSTPTHLVRAPALGGALEIVAASDLTSAILADDQNVYWSTMNDPHVYRMSHSGGPPVAIAALSSVVSEQIFLDAMNLYWTDGGSVWTVPTVRHGLLERRRRVERRGARRLRHDRRLEPLLHASWHVLRSIVGLRRSRRDADRRRSAPGPGVVRWQRERDGVRRAAHDDRRDGRLSSPRRFVRKHAHPRRLRRRRHRRRDEPSDRIYWATLTNDSVALKSMPKYAP